MKFYLMKLQSSFCMTEITSFKMGMVLSSGQLIIVSLGSQVQQKSHSIKMTLQEEISMPE